MAVLCICLLALLTPVVNADVHGFLAKPVSPRALTGQHMESKVNHLLDTLLKAAPRDETVRAHPESLLQLPDSSLQELQDTLVAVSHVKHNNAPALQSSPVPAEGVTGHASSFVQVQSERNAIADLLKIADPESDFALYAHLRKQRDTMEKSGSSSVAHLGREATKMDAEAPVSLVQVQQGKIVMQAHSERGKVESGGDPNLGMDTETQARPAGKGDESLHMAHSAVNQLKNATAMFTNASSQQNTGTGAKAKSHPVSLIEVQFDDSVIQADPLSDMALYHFGREDAHIKPITSKGSPAVGDIARDATSLVQSGTSYNASMAEQPSSFVQIGADGPFYGVPAPTFQMDL